MRPVDDLMHAPCAICGAMAGDAPKSFIVGGSVRSTCCGDCYAEYVRRYTEMLRGFL